MTEPRLLFIVETKVDRKKDFVNMTTTKLSLTASI